MQCQGHLVVRRQRLRKRLGGMVRLSVAGASDVPADLVIDPQRVTPSVIAAATNPHEHPDAAAGRAALAQRGAVRGGHPGAATSPRRCGEG
mmetsp:Transcript_15244/g.42006  ORF Transcript_15244/g.42006 Transcript_15244/m.42006 type:complete len:91 (-) Transcript_15244:3123-3395(-)